MLGNWWAATRPKTLGAAIAPVAMGTSIAIELGQVRWLNAAVALVAASLLQIGTNFANDYYDFKKGADKADRQGPPRAVAQGLISEAAMFRAMAIAFALAAACGAFLIYQGGWPIAIIGVLSIASGILYTGGPRPLAYIGLGDVFVLVFFGPVAVAGTVYVETLIWSWQAAVAGIGAGAIATAILVVNNLRDRHTDARAQKNTLAVRFGPGFTLLEYRACFVVAAAVPVGLAFTNVGALLALLTMAPAHFVWLGVQKNDGRALNPYLGKTAALLLLYALLFSVGWQFPHVFG